MNTPEQDRIAAIALSILTRIRLEQYIANPKTIAHIFTGPVPDAVDPFVDNCIDDWDFNVDLFENIE